MKLQTIEIQEYLKQKGIAFTERNCELITKCLFNDCDNDSRANEAHLYFHAETGMSEICKFHCFYELRFYRLRPLKKLKRPTKCHCDKNKGWHRFREQYLSPNCYRLQQNHNSNYRVHFSILYTCND